MKPMTTVRSFDYEPGSDHAKGRYSAVVHCEEGDPVPIGKLPPAVLRHLCANDAIRPTAPEGEAG